LEIVDGIDGILVKKDEYKGLDRLVIDKEKLEADKKLIESC